MIENLSSKPAYDVEIDSLFDRYQFEFKHTLLAELPPQRCSDEYYITDITVLDRYRNLDYKLIENVDYRNHVICGMARQSWFLVTSMSNGGIKSPLNVFEWRNIHPGKKRWIIANYLQLETVPTLNQFEPNNSYCSRGGTQVQSKADLDRLYGDNYTAQIKLSKSGHQKLECSWHSLTNMRDRKGYDNWYEASSVKMHNWILDYVLENGLQIDCVKSQRSKKESIFATHYGNMKDKDFYIVCPCVDLQDCDFWQLYFHFDPTVYKKICHKSGIEIINNKANNKQTMEVNLYDTIFRKWLPDPYA